MAIAHEDTLAVAPAATATDHAARAKQVRGPELVAGARLGHFQIVKKLGAGGMGEVYLATDLALDRPVALKVLPSGTTTGIARDRLVREARAQARVQHPNVAHIYFIGEDEGRLYFAMEYVTGSTLADTTAKGRMSVEDALAVVRDAVLGLREAQRSGFTHRDVKPSNLMIDGHGIVKVLDFGIAAGGATTDSETGGSIAQTSLAGTPLYMAPEQARGEPVDFRADVYALGATLYELVSGKPPFQAETFEKLVTLHATAERPALPRGIGTRTQSTALDSLIARMMAPRAEDRFASYDELLRALENASARFTRPAGFWVRAIGIVVDLLAVAIVLALVQLLLFDDGNVSMSRAGIPLLALLHVLLVARFGTTIGGALFELEVVDSRTGARPSWGTSARRVAFVYGPLLVLGWLGILVEELVRDEIYELGEMLYVLLVVVSAARLAYASLRVPGKRAPWDRRAHTIVRYRSGKQ